MRNTHNYGEKKFIFTTTPNDVCLSHQPGVTFALHTVDQQKWLWLEEIHSLIQFKLNFNSFCYLNTSFFFCFPNSKSHLLFFSLSSAIWLKTHVRRANKGLSSNLKGNRWLTKQITVINKHTFLEQRHRRSLQMKPQSYSRTSGRKQVDPAKTDHHFTPDVCALYLRFISDRFQF